MITITLAQAILAEVALNELGKISFPAKLSWKIGRITEEVRVEARGFEKVRSEKITSYGSAREGGGFEVPADKLQEFQDELNELLDSEIEIWGEKIKLSELGEKEIPVSVMQNAGWLFEEEAAKGATG